MSEQEIFAELQQIIIDHAEDGTDGEECTKAIMAKYPQITKNPVYLHLVDDRRFTDSGCHLKLYKPFYCSGDAKEWAKDYFVEVIE